MCEVRANKQTFQKAIPQVEIFNTEILLPCQLFEKCAGVRMTRSFGTDILEHGGPRLACTAANGIERRGSHFEVLGHFHSGAFVKGKAAMVVSSLPGSNTVQLPVWFASPGRYFVSASDVVKEPYK